MAASLWGYTRAMIIVDMIAAILTVVSQYRIHVKDKTICLNKEH